MSTWTKPYYGVSHLELVKNNVGPRMQATVTEWPSFTEAYVILRDSLRPFTPVAEGTFRTVEEARAWAEQSVAALGGKTS